MRKNFRIPADNTKTILRGLGSCLASDRITFDGQRVGFLYRERPDRAGDSGWRFLAGDESENYTNHAENLSLYDVNTIANYDQTIVPLLNSPLMSAFERDKHSGTFRTVSFPDAGRQRL